jgi:photosystem II stability/assembly factor-like uncharacterized protein
MTGTPNMEALYQDARTALKAKDYDRASDLLRQILVIDENYKDASRLLAQVVRHKRRRWYNDPRLFAAMGIAAVILVVIWLAPRMRDIYAAPIPPANTETPNTSIPPTQTIAMTAVPTNMPTATLIPYVWKRIYIGQEFPRDTVTEIVSHPADKDVLYIGLQNSGVYKTLDGGRSWGPKHAGLANTQVNALVIDPENSDILYAGTEGGLYKTENGGELWKAVHDSGVNHFLLDPKNSRHLYFSGGGRVFESEDGGASWKSNSDSTNMDSSCALGMFVFALDPYDSKVLYADAYAGQPGCQQGLYKSIDNGKNWSLIKEISNSRAGAFLAAKKTDGKDLFYFSDLNDIWTSDDLGKSWNRQNIRCDILEIDPQDPSVIFCTFVPGPSFDIVTNGQRVKSLGLNGDAVSAISVDYVDGKRRIVAGIETKGVFISNDDGKSWFKGAGGIGAAYLGLKSNPHQSGQFFLSSAYGEADSACYLYRSEDSGALWKVILSGPKVSWCYPAIDSDNNLYAIRDFKLAVSKDSGNSWSFRPIPKPMVWQISANPFASGMIFALGHDSPFIQYSEDSGNTWHAIEAMNKKNFYPELFFAGPRGERVYADGSYSDDGGKKWMSCGGWLWSSKYPSVLAIDPTDENHLFLATNGQGIQENRNGCSGESWIPVTAGIDRPRYPNAMAFDPQNNKLIYAGSQDGAYVSFDGGRTWSQINDGLLGANVVYSIAVDKDDNVFATTPYGVFQLERK